VAPGLALLLDRAAPRWYRWLSVLGCVLAGWNLLLICEYTYCRVPADAGANPGEMLAGMFFVARHIPLMVLVQAVGPIALWLLLRNRATNVDPEGAKTGELRLTATS
jgi:hypothetical protein